MRIEALRQCDVVLRGQRKALFPGQRYEVPDEEAQTLVLSGHVRLVTDARGVLTPAATITRIQGRPRARRNS